MSTWTYNGFCSNQNALFHLILIGTGDMLNAVCRVEVVLIFTMIGIPSLSEERISVSLVVIVPGRWHAIRTPVPRFEDGIRFNCKYLPPRAFPLE
jgi:hypothetical protein